MEISEGLKKIFLAGVGAVATTAESAKDLVDALVKKGEITVEQGKVLNEEIKRNAKEKVKDHVTVNIIKEYKDVMSAVEHMPQEDREILKEKLAALEKEEAERRAKKAEKESEMETCESCQCGECEDTCECQDGCDCEEGCDCKESSDDSKEV